MKAWSSVRFGAQTIALQRVSAKPPEEIGRAQRSRLERLVRHARAHSPFFREKFADLPDSGFSIADLPTSTKPELMDNFDRAVTADDLRRDEIERFMEDERNLGKYFLDKYVLSHTSGSQGQPLLLVQTKREIELLFALHASRGNRHSVSALEAAKRIIQPARLAAVILKPGFYPSAVAFEYSPEGMQPFITVLRVSIGDDDMYDRLADFEPTHLTAYSSILHELARAVEKGRISFQPQLQQVVNISERLIPQTRQHYEKLFGAPVLDDYGMGECLFLTNGCPTSGGMHVNADWAILEVVDEDNQPVPDGTKGAKVLVTNLAKYVQPIIRYEVGDIVTMATKPCECGSSLPLIEQIGGRDSDMFYVRSDKGIEPLSPAVFELAIGQMLDAREYQLIQEENRRFRILIEPLPGVEFDRNRARSLLDKQLQRYELDGQLTVELEIVKRLTPNSNSKFKRVVSKVETPSDVTT